MSSLAKRSKTSPILSFFTSVNDTEKIAQCDICSKKLCYSSSVTNLKKKHIERKHPIINLQISKASPHSSTEITTDDPDEPAATCTHIAAPSSTPVSAQGESAASSSHTATPPRQSSISSFVARKISETQKKKLNTILLKLFFLDFQPFSIVEDRGFVELIRALNPSYQLPTRKAITTTLLPAAYEQCKNVVLEKVSSARNVCLTTDCWTSKSIESYIALTAHYINEKLQLDSVLLDCSQINGPHTSSNLAATIKKITDRFNLSDKVSIVVTDNAANMKNAVINELKWKYFGSSSATEKLFTYQRNSGVGVPKKLLKDVVTRWNSTFYMLQRLEELEEPVKATIALINKDLPVLTEREWDICRDLCKILKPFEEVTRKLSGENYATGSQVIVLTRGLAAVCKKLQNEKSSSTVETVLQSLLKGISERFQSIEYSRTLAMCTFLDPRFRMIGFSDQIAPDSIKKHIIELVTKIWSKEKEKAWADIAVDFNRCSSEGERTATQLKTAYENYKRRIKKAAADDKAELHKTGGGSFKRKLDVDGERLIAKLHHNFTPLCNPCDSDGQYQVIEDVDADPVSYIESVETYFDGPLPVMSVEEVQTESHEEVVAHETVLSPSQSPSVNIPEAIPTAGLQQQMQITTSRPTARKHKRNRMEDYTSSKGAAFCWRNTAWR
ncbi:hypothetical protein ANN_14369 [Periplaneta americana]|uniref:Regulatory protein zeste n=1 Tax=Periplaneta americana TaxID=6978 RepID=A0ABQ8SX73_PERAM|nr:hypothetical protein ANN_14369 [Periplaneta americana]